MSWLIEFCKTLQRSQRALGREIQEGPSQYFMTWRAVCGCANIFQRLGSREFCAATHFAIVRRAARGNKAAAAVAPRRRRRPSKCPQRLTPAAADGRLADGARPLSASRRRDLREDDPVRSLSAQIRSPTCAAGVEKFRSHRTARARVAQKSRPPVCSMVIRAIWRAGENNKRAEWERKSCANKFDIVIEEETRGREMKFAVCQLFAQQPAATFWLMLRPEISATNKIFSVKNNTLSKEN